MTAIKRTDTTPRVSIICRTMSRNSLHDTLRSVLNQTWPALELVLVDAANVGAEALARTASSVSDAAHVSLHIVATGKSLNRPQAANAGLAAATGSHLLFLDDDDWIAAEHISRLMATTQSHPDCQVIYSATQKTNAEARLLDDIIAVPFDRTVLRRDNFIPIHAALFSAALRERGCHFDEGLDVYEDWDFWLQCAELTDFLLDDHIGAFYRMGGESETMLTEHQARYQPGHPMAEARAKLLDKWKSRWTGAQWNAVLGLVDQTPLVHSLHQDLTQAHQQLNKEQQALELVQQQLEEQQQQLEERQEQLTELRSNHEQLQITSQQLLEDYQNLQVAHIELNLAHQALDQGVRKILSSFSWRVTAPYRWTRHRISDALSGTLLKHQRPQTKTPAADTSVSINNNNPLLCGIVSPPSDNLAFSTTMTVQAWAWSPASLQSIVLLVDGKQLHSIDPLPQHETPEEAQRIGFARALDTAGLSPGEHVITLVCTDNKGHRTECTRQFICQRPQTLYSRWRQQQITTPLISQPPKTDFHVLLAVSTSDAQSADALLATLDSLLAQDLTAMPQVHWRCSIISKAANHPALTALLSTHAAWPRTQLIADHADFAPAPDSVVAMLQPGETLHRDCLGNVAVAWQPDTQLLYTDHDRQLAAGKFTNPWFTFAWSPELLLSQNYIGGVYFIRADMLPTLAMDTPAWRYDCLLQLRERLDAGRVIRIPRVLWHEPDTATTSEAELDVLRTHMARHNCQIELPWPQASNIRHVRRPLPTSAPRVSIIIPTTGNMRFLKPCLDTLAGTDYPDMEIVILDNSRGKHPEGIAYARESGAIIVDCDEAFNWSRLNNKGADNSSGEILLFLNDDIEIVQPEWLQEMVRQVVQDDVGTVGCLLLYPNGAIQHGGVFLVDHGGGARHLFHKQLPGAGIYQQLDKSVREVSASTGACLMIQRECFEQLDRFDEELSIVGNDIDLCLRCLEAGLRNVWTPHSVLIHHESVSRQSKPIGRDEKTMWRRWGQRFKNGDPYYNPSLSLLREDCALASQAATPGGPAISTGKSGTHGVNLIAYIRASMGVGEAARGNASALQASGLPFGIINYERGNPSRMDNLRWQHKEISGPQFQVNILHINADHLPVVMKELGRAWFKDRYNIGFWAWEMPEFPDQWLSSFDLLDEIWVPSTYVNQSVAAKSPVPVITIPHVIDIDMQSAQRYSREHFGINKQAFVFISMFDTHSIAQRKNPFGSILAFQQAFAADDLTVQLVIKVNNADDANTAVLHECIDDYKNILVLDQHYDRTQIDSLINCIDCYVSLHHAEGFGLGPAEAMALGKVALLTDWSGNTEYMTADNCVPIHYKIKTLGKDYGPYEAHQHWAVADIQHAASEMQDLATNPARVADIGERARSTIQEKFSAQAIGERMRKRLQSIERITTVQRKRTHV